MKKRFIAGGLALVLSLAGCGSDGGDANTSAAPSTPTAPTAPTTPTAQHAIGGTVNGLAAGKQVAIQNGDETLTISADGAFAFAKKASTGGSYNVAIATHPDGQTCTVSGGHGTGVNADVSSVKVTCSTTTYAVGGSVAGLTAGRQLTLANNGGDNLVISADGAFAFPAPIAHGGGYNVTIGSQPSDQTCTVNGFAGAGVTANVNTIRVVCATNTYRVSASVTGLLGTSSVTLQLNGAETQSLSTGNSVAFNTPIAQGGSYSVTVLTQPVGLTCSVSNGSGTGMAADVSNVAVTCAKQTFPVGGVVYGMAPGLQVTLLNNGADPITVSSNGTYSFPNQIPYNGSYNVTVLTHPRWQNCTVANGSGPVVTGAVTNVYVSCFARASYVYVSSQDDSTVTTYQVAGDGTLIHPSTLNTGSVSASLTTMPGIPHLLAVRGANTAVSYAIGTSGWLTGLSGITSVEPAPLAMAASQMTGFAYVVNATNKISPVKVGSDGTLTSFPSVQTGPSPSSVAVDSSGQYVYVTTSGDNKIYSYRAYGNGTLIPFDAMTALLNGPHVLTLAQDVGMYATLGEVQAVSVERNGSLGVNPVPNPLLPDQNSPYAIAASPYGPYFYVVGASLRLGGAGSLKVFKVERSLGLPTAVAIGTLVPTGVNPTAVTVDASGRYVYVTNAGDNTISQYQIESDGSVTPLGTISTGRNPRSIAAWMQ